MVHVSMVRHVVTWEVGSISRKLLMNIAVIVSIFVLVSATSLTLVNANHAEAQFAVIHFLYY